MLKGSGVVNTPVSFELYEHEGRYIWYSGNAPAVVPPAKTREEAVRMLKSRYAVLHVSGGLRRE